MAYFKVNKKEQILTSEQPVKTYTTLYTIEFLTFGVIIYPKNIRCRVVKSGDIEEIRKDVEWLFIPHAEEFTFREEGSDIDNE